VVLNRGRVEEELSYRKSEEAASPNRDGSQDWEGPRVESTQQTPEEDDRIW